MYFNGGEIVETESEGEITDNSAWLGLGDRRFIRGFQQEDFYDVHTNFTPFSLQE